MGKRKVIAAAQSQKQGSGAMGGEADFYNKEIINPKVLFFRTDENYESKTAVFGDD